MSCYKMEFVWLGTGGAFTNRENEHGAAWNYQSNLVVRMWFVERDKPVNVLIDGGTTLIKALARAKISPLEIDYVFLTHLHSDHAGGLGELQLINYFVKQNHLDVVGCMHPTSKIDVSAQPVFIGVGNLTYDAWDKCWCGGNETLEGMKRPADIELFANVIALNEKEPVIRIGSVPNAKNGVEFMMFQTSHVSNSNMFAPSYGVKWTTPTGERVVFTGDTQNNPVQLKTAHFSSADIIFHDTQTTMVNGKPFKSGVHAHILELVETYKDQPQILEKINCYHYDDDAFSKHDPEKYGMQPFVIPYFKTQKGYKPTDDEKKSRIPFGEGNKWVFEVSRETRAKMLTRQEVELGQVAKEISDGLVEETEPKVRDKTDTVVKVRKKK